MAHRTGRTTRLGFMVAAVFVVGTSLGAFIAPAGAATTVRHGSDDSVVVVTGDVSVPESSQVKHVIVADGDVTVNGSVTGDVFVVNGNVHINGRVHSDVTSLNGRVTLGPDAFVGGDVVSKDPARITDGAHVGGSVDRARDRFALGRLGTIGRVVLWIAGTVSSLLLGVLLLLIAPRGADAVVAAGRAAIGPAIGLGFAVVFGVPVLGIFLSVTILGLPLGLALLFALALLYGTGYALGALIVGRVMVRPPRSRWLAFLAGWVLLRVLAIVPVLGALVLFATVVYALGAAVVAISRAQRSHPAPDAIATAPPTTPPAAPSTAPATPIASAPTTSSLPPPDGP